MTVRRKLSRIVAAGGAVAVLMGLAACAGDSSEDGPTKITFSYLWAGDEAKIVESLIETFNESQDDVVVEGISNPDGAAQLASLSGSRAQFDVSDHFGESVGAWVDQGLLADLTPFIEADQFDIDDFVPESIEPLTVDGNVYSLPLSAYTYQLVYNKKAFEEAGLQPPTTIEEMLEAGRALTTTENGRVTRLGFGPVQLKGMNWQLGGEWTKDGEPAPTTDEAVASLQLYLDQIAGLDESAVRSFVASFGDYWSADNPFFNGQVAMVIDGPWLISMSERYAPDFEYGVVEIPVPAAKPELAGTAPLNVSTVFIAANSEKKEAAWEFVKFMVSPEALLAFNVPTTNIPARSSMAASPELAELGPNYQAFVTSLNEGQLKYLPAAPWTVEYGALMATAQNEVYDGTTSPQDAVARLVEAAKGLGE